MTMSAYPYYSVMLMDDEEQALKRFGMTLRSTSMNNFICCHDSRDVIPLLQSRNIEVILLDLRMPNISGEELLPKIVGDYFEIPVIIVNGAQSMWKSP